MPELIEAYWPYLLIAFAIGVAVAWFAFVATRKTSVATDKRDVLDEGAAPAARNQALIDTPATISDPVADDTAPLTPAAIKTANATPSSGDDLTRIKGLGPKLAVLLKGQGITTFGQIAGWDDAAIDRVDATLGKFAGRIRRDSWVEQAKMLSTGKDSEFSEKFGNNG
jgi:predicted flap endonuclease-1-like 5' DNA nuclease